MADGFSGLEEQRQLIRDRTSSSSTERSFWSWRARACWRAGRVVEDRQASCRDVEAVSAGREAAGRGASLMRLDHAEITQSGDGAVHGVLRDAERRGERAHRHRSHPQTITVAIVLGVFEHLLEHHPRHRTNPAAQHMRGRTQHHPTPSRSRLSAQRRPRRSTPTRRTTEQPDRWWRVPSTPSAAPAGTASRGGSPAGPTCRPTPDTRGRADSRASGRSATPESPPRSSTADDQQRAQTTAKTRTTT